MQVVVPIMTEVVAHQMSLLSPVMTNDWRIASSNPAWLHLFSREPFTEIAMSSENGGQMRPVLSDEVSNTFKVIGEKLTGFAIYVGIPALFLWGIYKLVTFIWRL